MAIRFRDVSATRAQLIATLDGAGGGLIGSHVGPPGRSGTLASQLAGVSSSLTGLFSPSIAVTGILASVLGGVSGVLAGNSTAPISSWQLAPGHYDPSVAAPVIAFPRPDVETNTYERHRLCPAGIPWRFPLGMIYGAWPFKYSIVSGPAGLTIGQTYGSANYQIMNWDNPVVGTYSITAQVNTQDFGRIGSSADPLGQYQVTFTLTVAPQTDSRFFSLDAVNGSDTNAGTFAAPWKTLAAFKAASTNGGQLFFRNGTYNFNALTSLLDLTSKAKVFVGYPGETVVINYGGAWSGASCYTGFFGNGCSSSNITWSGSPSNWAGGSSDLYYINHAGDRGVYYENTFSGLDGKLTAPANFSNWCAIAMFASTSMHKYVGAVNNTIQNFNGMNNGGGLIWYSVKNWLVEGNTIQGFTNAGNAQSGFYLKGHCSIGSLRNCRVPNQSISTSPLHIYQGPDGGSGDAPNGNEVCWNYAVLTPPGNNGSAGSAHTYGPASYSSWNGWTHRNTIIGATFFNAASGFPSTLRVNNNVLCTEHAGRINDALSYGAQPNLTETDVGNVLDTFANRNAVVDPSTGYLLSAYAAAHGIALGTAGHQVL